LLPAAWCNLFILALAFSWNFGGDVARAGNQAVSSTSSKGPFYPVKPSINNRYLVDQNNVPFMVVSDSPHSLIGRMSKSDAQFYMSNRQQYGINTLWVELLCNDKTGCNADGTTSDGIPPFTASGDISSGENGMRAATKGDYEVGYGKPPRGGGFKKGQSRAGGPPNSKM
jgi:hypothetical protein